MVPTTAGTGAEATLYSVVTNHELCRKCSIRSFYLYPTVALIGPALTLEELHLDNPEHPDLRYASRKLMEVIGEMLERTVTGQEEKA